MNAIGKATEPVAAEGGGEMPALLRLGEVLQRAKRARVGEYTVRRWIATGELCPLPHLRGQCGRRRYRRSDLETLLEEQSMRDRA